MSDALLPSKPIDLRDLTKCLAEAMFKDLSSITHFGNFFAELATLVPKYVRGEGIERVLVVVDEVVDTLGVNVEVYAKAMESIMNVNRPPELMDVVVNFIALTSEGWSRGLLARHSYAWQEYMWNMPRRDFEELYYRARELYPGPAPPFEDVWRLYGGNPRRLEELIEENWDLERHRRRLVREKRIDQLVIEIRAEGLENEAVKVVEDPDILWREPTNRLVRVERMLMRANLMMDAPRGIELGAHAPGNASVDGPPVDKELGIGRVFAWQVLIYRDLLMELLREE